MNNLTKAIELLEAQGQEVVLITPTHVLCLWAQDNSYVSWRWYMTDDSNIATECGIYLQSTLYNQDEAIEMFHSSQLPYEAQAQVPMDTNVIDYDKEFEDFSYKGDLVTDLESMVKQLLNESPELIISY